MADAVIKAAALKVLARQEAAIVEAIRHQPHSNTDTERRLLAQRHAYILEAKAAITAAL